MLGFVRRTSELSETEYAAHQELVCLIREAKGMMGRVPRNAEALPPFEEMEKRATRVHNRRLSAFSSSQAARIMYDACVAALTFAQTGKGAE